MSGQSLAKPSTDPALDNASEAGSRQLWLARAAAFILAGGGAAITPFVKVKLLEVSTFLPMYAIAMIIISFLLSVLLLIRGSVEQQGNTTRLGGIYLFVTLIMIAQVATYPGAFVPAALIGGPSSSPWVWFLWHIGFALMILHYAWSARRPIPVQASLFVTIAVAASLALGMTFLAAWGTNILPPVFPGGNAFYKGQGSWWLLCALCCLTMTALACVIRLRGRTPEQVWLTIALLAALLDVWLNWVGGSRFSLGWYLAKAASLLTSLTLLISKVHEITQLYSTAARNNKLLQSLVHKDGLTGLSNRRRFDELLELEFRRARRQSLPLGLILIDVDWFKSYNDTYGHQAGDECLRTVSGAISSVLHRAGDEIARYGGEEMVAILPVTDLHGTITLAERMCAAVAALQIEHEGSAYGIVTISAGTSVLISFDEGAGPGDLVAAADKALYQAKGSGRNKVCSFKLQECSNKAFHAA